MLPQQLFGCFEVVTDDIFVGNHKNGPFQKIIRLSDQRDGLVERWCLLRQLLFSIHNVTGVERFDVTIANQCGYILSAQRLRIDFSARIINPEFIKPFFVLTACVTGLFQIKRGWFIIGLDLVIRS